MLSSMEDERVGPPDSLQESELTMLQSLAPSKGMIS
jgi:hypothetical protein